MDKTCHKNLENSKYIDLIMAMGKSFQNSLAVPEVAFLEKRLKKYMVFDIILLLKCIISQFSFVEQLKFI